MASATIWSLSLQRNTCAALQEFHLAAMASPTKDNDPSTRKNFDKRTIRKMHAKSFEHAISGLHRQSQTNGDEPVLQYTAQDVQVRCETSDMPPAVGGKGHAAMGGERHTFSL